MVGEILPAQLRGQWAPADQEDGDQLEHVGCEPFLKSEGGPGAGGKASARLPDGYSALPHPWGGGSLGHKKSFGRGACFRCWRRTRGQTFGPSDTDVSPFGEPTVAPICLGK